MSKSGINKKNVAAFSDKLHMLTCGTDLQRSAITKAVIYMYIDSTGI